MKTSIVLATFNKIEYTQHCIQSIRAHTPPDEYEIIVVDNHSTDGTVDWLKQQTDVISIFNDDNLGFPKACNQGIKIASGENILLLNNDTIVTKNWLSNLVLCLYHSDKIGAVGAVTNNCSYYQSIEVDYPSIEEMHKFAAGYNHSNPMMWEERLKLIGFCMLIKRSVVDQIGLLDEIFTPGNYEDDDYSLRIRKAGYKLILCKDTFIHHFGSVSFRESMPIFIDLLTKNKLKFIDKWGYDPDIANLIRLDVLMLINKPKDSAIRVLEVGCACGGTLLKIKSEYPNAMLYGIETNPITSKISNLIAQVSNQPYDEILDDFNESYFDIVIFGDNIHTLEAPTHVLSLARRYLKEDGILIASIPNSSHFSELKKIMDAELNQSEVNHLSPMDINLLFENAGYKHIEINYTTLPKRTEDELFLKELNKLNDVGITKYYEVYKFLVSARRSESQGDMSRAELTENKSLIVLILETEKEIRVNENAKEIVTRIQSNQVLLEVLELIDKQVEKKIDMYNLLAVTGYENKNYDFILPFLQKAHEQDPYDKDTLINISIVLTEFGEPDLALSYANKIIDKSDDVIGLIQNITDSIKLTQKKDENILEIEQNDVVFTGERLVINQEVKNNYNNVLEEHLHRYQLACRYAEGKVILDAACGAGYGTKMLEQAGAKLVMGVDVSEECLDNARKVYSASNVDFGYGDVNKLPFEDTSFDVVVSFETIEHIERGANWIRESARVLKDEGVFLVSTPNRMITNPGTYFAERPMNPHHRFEYSVTEFVGELLKEYDILELYGQTFQNDHESYYSKIMREVRKMDTQFVPIKVSQTKGHELIPLGEIKDMQPMYVVAVCRKKRSKVT